ncbi:MAG: DsbA family protein [Gemmatimonadetes bacterium]|nr:DsbA family protein [Gemmatimonadota bacterium]
MKLFHVILTLAAAGALLGAPGSAGAQRASAAPGAQAAPPSTLPDTAKDARIARADRGRIRGRSGTVWVVVISDYQCPFCKKWHEETAPLIERDYVRTGKVQIAYMNYPIPSIHPNAMAAHEVAMCAAEQDRFWPVSDALFRTQGDWKNRRDVTAFFDSLTRTIALDRPRYERCMRSGEMRQIIEADVERSSRIGVGSTPSFLIGGRPVIGAQPYEAFKRAIDAALAATPAP